MAACGATATEILIRADGRVEVSGTTTGCREFMLAVTGLTSEKAVTADAAGTWSVVFDATDLVGDLAQFQRESCGQSAKYDVRCTEPGTDCQQRSNAPVRCEDGPACPPAVIVIDDVADCADGGRTVDFHAEVTGGGNGVFQWLYGDGETSVLGFLPAPDGTGLRIVNGTHDYSVGPAGSSYTLTLSVAYADTGTECRYTQVVDLTKCDSTCPTQVTLEVVNASNTRVDATDCLPSGTYTVRITDPVGTGLVYGWTVGGTLQSGVTGSSLPVPLGTGQTLVVAVAVVEAGCPPLAGSVTLEECTDVPCPDLSVPTVAFGDCVNDTRSVQLTAGAQGAAGQTVGIELVQPQPDGSEPVLAAQTGTGSVALSHTQSLAPGTYQVIIRTTQPTGCSDEQVLNFTVPGCDPPPRTRTDVFSLCPLLRLFTLLAFGLAVLGTLLLLCPALMPPPAGTGVGIGLVIGGLLLAAIGLGLWIWLCEPTPCDWLLMAWQALLLIGFLMVYAGLCPLCAWMLAGVLALIAGAGLLVYWGRTCNPSRCRVYIELIGFFLIVIDVVGLVAAVLTPCVITSAPLGALTWAGMIASIQTWLWYQASTNECFVE